MEQLRKLDKAVTRPGTIASLVIGIIGTLIMGVGMCMCLIPDWADKLFGLGIAIGIVGIAILAAAYPVYLRLTAKQKEKLAPQILKLAEELSE